MTKQTYQIILLLIFFFSLGCTKRDPQPHLKDPIYRDLSSEHSRHQKMVEEQLKEVSKLEAELASTEVRTIDKRIKLRDLQTAKERLGRLKEGAEYYRIRADLRKVYAKRDYNRAFDEGAVWPDPKELEAYQTNKRLRNVSLNWSERVPKARHQEVKQEGSDESTPDAAAEKALTDAQGDPE